MNFEILVWESPLRIVHSFGVAQTHGHASPIFVEDFAADELADLLN